MLTRSSRIYLLFFLHIIVCAALFDCTIGGPLPDGVSSELDGAISSEPTREALGATDGSASTDASENKDTASLPDSTQNQETGSPDDRPQPKDEETKPPVDGGAQEQIFEAEPADTNNSQDECNSTGDCRAKYGARATDCVGSRSNTSYCQCGAERCSTGNPPPDVPPTSSCSSSANAPQIKSVFTGHTTVDILYTKPTQGTVVSYKVSVKGGVSYDVKARSATLGLLKPSTQYTIEVQAKYADGTSSPPGCLKITTKATPKTSDLPVIPGPYGYGMNGPIARGKPIFRVTNLNKSGKGSLDQAGRDAEQAGGGTIVFEVSGVINHGEDNLLVRGDNIVIAGQTAPAPGIFVRGGLRVRGKNIVIRHIGGFAPTVKSQTTDALAAYGHNGGSKPERLIIDHVAAWGANDETVDLAKYDGGRVTLQWTFIGAPVRTGHGDKGNVSHNYNALFDNGKNGGDARITMRRNHLTMARDRQPLVRFRHFNFYNNLLDDRTEKGRFVYIANGDNDYSINCLINNVFFDTYKTQGTNPVLCAGGMKSNSKIHLKGNHWNLDSKGVPANQWLLTTNCSKNLETNACTIWHPENQAWDVNQLRETVLPRVGPRPKERNPFIKKLIEQFAKRKGFPDNINAIGGDIKVTSNKRAFTISNPHTAESNGYTRLENKLNEMALQLQ